MSLTISKLYILFITKSNWTCKKSTAEQHGAIRCTQSKLKKRPLQNLPIQAEQTY